MMRLRQCWGVEGAHFAPRRSEIYVFPLEIRVPTRPGLERLVGHGQGPRSGEREAPGQSQQASEGGEYGAAEPRPVGTVAEQEGRGWGRTQYSHGPLFHQGPRQDTDGGLHLQGFLPQLALQVLRDQVGLVMLGEMVTPHEALLTLGTLEAFVPWEEEMPITHRAHVQTLSQPRKRRSTCEI